LLLGVPSGCALDLDLIGAVLCYWLPRFFSAWQGALLSLAFDFSAAAIDCLRGVQLLLRLVAERFFGLGACVSDPFLFITVLNGFSAFGFGPSPFGFFLLVGVPCWFLCEWALRFVLLCWLFVGPLSFICFAGSLWGPPAFALFCFVLPSGPPLAR